VRGENRGGRKMEKISQSNSQGISLSNSESKNFSKKVLGEGNVRSSNNVSDIKARDIKASKKPKRKKREQSGNFHVWFRGNGRFTVFYDESDFEGFLKRCDAAAKKYDTKIVAFVLLDNHIHLHVITESLTQFASTLLTGVSQWLNNRNGFTGKLFESPFGSSRIYSKALIAENLLYIFSNPMNAGICINPWGYKWCSYHFHNSRLKNPLENLIAIDTETVVNAFPTKGALDKAIFNFNLNGSPTQPEKQNWPRIPDNEVAKCMNTILNGRKLSDLSKDELIKLMVVLKHRDGATYRQIASLTHESYLEVRRVLQRSFLQKSVL